jgi:hypothetical protein
MRQKFYALLLVCLMLLLTTLSMALTDEQVIRNATWYTQQVAPGISWKTCRFTNLFSSQQDIYVGTLDLNSVNVRLSFSYASGSGKTVSTFASQIPGTMLAVNGSYYNTANHIPVQYLRVTGYSYVSNLATAGTSALLADSTGRNVSVSYKSDISGGNWANLPQANIMATLYEILKNGENATLANDTYMCYTRHPRTAVGKTADNKLLVVVVDGRSSRAAGMTLPEMQVLMKALNCVNAINMDGGGSSTFWVKGYGSNGVVNIPSDGSQRAVANAIHFVVTATSNNNAYIFESRSGGQNFAYYSESGEWGNNDTPCNAIGVTAGLGTRYGSTYKSVAGLKKATFQPNLAQGGQYKVWATWPAAANRRSNITYNVKHQSGISSVRVDQSATANEWVLIGTYQFTAGSDGYVQVSNENIDISGSMYAGAIKFELITPSATENWINY